MFNTPWHYRSVADLNEVVTSNLARIPHDVDLVVGVPRSGLLAATLISLYLNRPLTDLQGLAERRLLGKGKRLIPGYGADAFDDARRILVVDDCVSQGTEMMRSKEFVESLGLSEKTTFLTVFSFPEKPHLADITLEVIPRPMCFQWSFMHTPELKNYCLDIDGVICRDATKAEDDDGSNYEHFLKNASPLFVPTEQVGWLITSRLEKYRALTEEWLKRHGVQYSELIMMDLPTKEARERLGIHVQYKADAYVASGAKLFIESSPGIAALIAERTQKPVLCMTTNRIIGNPDLESLSIWHGRITRQIRRFARAPRRILSLRGMIGKHQRSSPKISGGGES